MAPTNSSCRLPDSAVDHAVQIPVVAAAVEARRTLEAWTAWEQLAKWHTQVVSAVGAAAAVAGRQRTSCVVP